MKTIRIITLTSVLLGSSLFAGDLFPLQPGNTWIYREAKAAQTFTVTVGLPYLLNDHVYYKLAGYTADPLLVRQDDQNQLVYFDEENRREVLLTSFTPFESGWWQANGRQCDQEGQTRAQRITHDGVAGPIREVLQIRYRSFGCADAGTENEEFAESIGMLRRTVTTFAGPRQYDLVYAKVGSVLIDAMPRARFSVTADWTQAVNAVKVTLRLQSNSQVPVKLSFPTAQEYEILLRDSTGRVVWSWSAGQFFAQFGHDRIVTSDWSATVALPKPPGSGPAPQSYTLQAWLTTGSDTPQFAATVPLSITPQQ